jgi:hypothetical protein
MNDTLVNHLAMIGATITVAEDAQHRSVWVPTWVAFVGTVIQ